ncbi:hypothetical protein Hte_007844 [Hypoxylon texense]
MFMFMTDDYFGRLVTLSSLEQLARGLTSLEYAPITIAHPIYDKVDYEDLVFIAHGDEWPPPPGGYLRYRTLAKEQKSIMEENKDYQWFLSALPLFPRLRDFKLHCGDVSSVLMLTLTDNEEKCAEFDYDNDLIDIDAGSRHFDALLRALSDAKFMMFLGSFSTKKTPNFTLCFNPLPTSNPSISPSIAAPMKKTTQNAVDLGVPARSENAFQPSQSYTPWPFISTASNAGIITLGSVNGYDMRHSIRSYH